MLESKNADIELEQVKLPHTTPETTKVARQTSKIGVPK